MSHDRGGQRVCLPAVGSPGGGRRWMRSPVVRPGVIGCNKCRWKHHEGHEDFGLDWKSSVGCNKGSRSGNGPGRQNESGMFRFLLVGYLLLAAIAGNHPCCCSAARWLGWVQTWGGASDVVHPPISTCCSSGAQLRSAITRRALKAGPLTCEMGRSGGANCQCQSGPCQGVVPQPVPVPDGLAECSEPLPELFGLVGIRPMQGPVTRRGKAVFTPPPLLSGRSLRMALCSWHC